MIAVMVRIGVGKDDVIITLDAKEKFLAMKRRVAIPKEGIVSVSTERAKPSWISFKMGTHFPRGFMAGTFWTRKGKSFYYVRDFAQCVTLHLKNHEYSRVVIEVDDKEQVAKELKEAL
jgi:hypothetical protein